MPKRKIVTLSRPKRILIFDIDAIRMNAHEEISLDRAFQMSKDLWCRLNRMMGGMIDFDIHYIQVIYFSTPIRVKFNTRWADFEKQYERRVALRQDLNEDGIPMGGEGQRIYEHELERDGLDDV